MEDVNNIKLQVFRKVNHTGVVNVNGKNLKVFSPVDVDGKILATPTCEPKTDFDTYYKYNLAYFNLYASAVAKEYFGVCENTIADQKLSDPVTQIGKGINAAFQYQWLKAGLALCFLYYAFKAIRQMFAGV